MVTLYCAIVGVAGSAFPVDINETLSVGHLKDAIKAKNSTTIACDAKDLQLFLAKQGDAWLTEADVKKGVEDTTGLKLLDAARARLRRVGLSDQDVGGVDEEEEAEGRGPVNVLVVVPKQENDRSPAMALGVAPSLPPTTIHRHPERLKRWAAINAMIRQKNQEANQKTTSEDAKKTNKKRKNHDVDKTVGYS
ncbi:hypothetical protein PR003_g14844, partial [Phytophthora rubi]